MKYTDPSASAFPARGGWYFTVRPAFRRRLLACFLLPLLAFLALPGRPAAAQQPTADGLLTLREAVQVAMENNYQIQMARNRAAISRNNFTRGNAGFLPTVGLTAQQSQSSLLNFGNGGTGAFGTGSSFDLAAGASITVFDGMRRFATYERLGVEKEIGELDAVQSAENILADVIILYFDIAQQQQQLQVIDEAIAISEERVRIAELRRDLGSASELEVRQAQVDLNTDRAGRLRQEVVLTNLKATLNQRLGQGSNFGFRVSDSIAVDRTLRIEALSSRALRSNKALQLAERDRNVAELLRREVRAERLPRIDLRAGYAFNDLTSQIGLPTLRPGGFNYGITASFDLFEGFNRGRRIENASLQIANSALEIQEVRTRLQTELENAYLTYQNSLTLVDLEEENAALAQQNVDVALERFRLGTITSVELREVQTALTNIESRLISARFEAKRAEVNLLRLSGGLLETRDL